MTRAGTSVVHLVWAPLGPEPLARFVDSYRRHDPGVPHGLLVLLNGFESGQDLGPWRELLKGIDHEELRLQPPLLDLAAYAEATRHVPAERYCFVNSHSVVLADGWLGALEAALLASAVGLVGATGSWGSVRSYNRFMLGFGGPYAEVFGDRRDTNATLAAVSARQRSAEPQTRRAPIRFLRALLGQSYGFRSFPAPHIRTNAFMLAGEVWDRLRIPSPRRKSDAYRLESGRASITAQVEALGLTARVVGRDGCAHDPCDWPASETFWQGDQANLLIADNQTGGYQRADGHTRQVLAQYAWGPRARAETEPLALDRLPS